MIDFNVKINVARDKIMRFFKRMSLVATIPVTTRELRMEFGYGTEGANPAIRKALSENRGEVIRIFADGYRMLLGTMSRSEAQEYVSKRIVELLEERGAIKRMGEERLFRWKHNPSKHPREEHEKLDGEVFSLDNPPVIDSKTGKTGFPGELPNCHCVLEEIQ